MTEKKSLFRGRHLARPLSSEQSERIKRMMPEISIPLEKCSEIIDEYKKNNEEIHLEIGFGAGEHLIERAKNSPNIIHIGVEPFLNGVAKILKSIEEENLENIKIFTNDARLLIDKIPKESISRSYILFADPWPKSKHHKRRIINNEVLKNIGNITKKNAELFIATDHKGYQQWISDLLQENDIFKVRNKYISHPSHWPYTRYEIKALDGEDIIYWELYKN